MPAIKAAKNSQMNRKKLHSCFFQKKEPTDHQITQVTQNPTGPIGIRPMTAGLSPRVMVIENGEARQNMPLWKKYLLSIDHLCFSGTCPNYSCNWKRFERTWDGLLDSLPNRLTQFSSIEIRVFKTFNVLK